jgi:anti-sigma factor RsiW
MNCTKSEVLLHVLIDGERDAGHTSDVETHVATCSGCTENLKTFRAMRVAMAGADLKWDGAIAFALSHRGRTAFACGVSL